MSVDTACPIRVAEITGNLQRLFEPGQVIELRCIGPGKALSGFFNDWEALAHYALIAEDLSYACYFGLSPRDPNNCFPTNELEPGKTASAEDISCRRWLLIDADPVRPGNVCSTDAEKKAAAAVLKEAVHWLCKVQGWPAPLLADSGNGHHALFRIILPSEDDGLVERCLSTLASKFSTKQAKIDTGVFDSARICRLYGTKNCKGESTPERPQRISQLLGTNNAKPVPIEKLEAVALLTPTTPVNSAKQVKPATTLGLDHQNRCAATMARMLNKDRDDDRPGIENYEILLRATDWMNDQPLAVSGEGGHNQTFAVACGLVVGHGLSIAEARPILAEYNKKLDEQWTDEELAHKLANAEEKTGENPDRIGWLLKKHIGGNPPEASGGTSQADKLTSIIRNQELWHTPDKIAYATVTIQGHKKNLRIESKAFEHWLGSVFFDGFDEIAKNQAKSDAINTAIGLAIYGGPTHPVYLRLAEHNGKLYLDLGDDEWQAVEIDKQRWRIISDPPVKFRRTAGMRALPEPRSGGNIRDLRKFVNVASDEDFALIVAWLLMGFHPTGEYPILVLGGQQGTSKSTTAKVLRSLLDPNEADLRSTPRTEDDFAVEASNNRLLVFDNLSWVTDWLSDALCRLASGGANAKRRLYTDADEAIVRYCGPAIINGVVDLARRPDLLDRCILIDLPILKNTLTKRSFWSEFETFRPRILGALLDCVSSALAQPRPVDAPPRMAEFAEWIHSAEPKLAQQWNLGYENARQQYEIIVAKLTDNAESAHEHAVAVTEPQDKRKAATLADKAKRSAEEAENSAPLNWTTGALLQLYRNNIQKAKLSGLEQSPIVPALLDFADKKNPWKGTSTVLLKELTSQTGGTRISQGKGWPNSPISLGNTLSRLAPSLAAVGVIVEKGHSGKRFWTIQKEE